MMGYRGDKQEVKLTVANGNQRIQEGEDYSINVAIAAAVTSS